MDADDRRPLTRRVFGLETEYGFFCEALGVRLPTRENVVRWVFEQTVPGARNGSVFLENGGRFYLDSGFHPEYATPEADQVSDLVAHDKAGASSEISCFAFRPSCASSERPGRSSRSRTIPTPSATPKDAMRTTSCDGMCRSDIWPPPWSRSS